MSEAEILRQAAGVLYRRSRRKRSLTLRILLQFLHTTAAQIDVEETLAAQEASR
jgi:hypothetical protein